jgi:hypothetical protein
MSKALYLSPPSFDGFDGGAGARYQTVREVTSSPDAKLLAPISPQH